MIVFALGGAGVALIGFIFCLCLNKYRRQIRTQQHGREVIENVIELGKGDNKEKKTIITFPVIVNTVNEETFVFRVFSSERPKTGDDGVPHLR